MYEHHTKMTLEEHIHRVQGNMIWSAHQNSMDIQFEYIFKKPQI